MCVFLFKQKTAYEMRISDWSSDVCSSDLLVRLESDKFVARNRRRGGKDVEAEGDERNLVAARRRGVRLIKADEIELVEYAARGRKMLGNLVLHRSPPGVARSEERRVGQVGACRVSTGGWGGQYKQQTK